jgi:hypothetical protein
MAAQRHLYEKLVFHQGYLVIPFQCGRISGCDLFSYKLLAAFDRRGQFHKAENPGELFGESVEGIVAIAREFLETHSDLNHVSDYPQQRYVYQGNLIIISQIAEKYFYDHYPPDSLNNLSAPRLFLCEDDCIAWVKQGIDRLHSPSTLHGL